MQFQHQLIRETARLHSRISTQQTMEINQSHRALRDMKGNCITRRIVVKEREKEC